MSYPEFLLDKRVVQRYIAKTIVDKQEYEKVLTALPDVKDNAETLTVGIPGGEPARSSDEG